MRNDVVQKLVDRWEKDMAFRELMRKDPSGAVMSASVCSGRPAVMRRWFWSSGVSK